jgi:hypothetical protein
MLSRLGGGGEKEAKSMLLILSVSLRRRPGSIGTTIENNWRPQPE